MKEATFTHSTIPVVYAGFYGYPLPANGVVSE